MVVVKKYMLLFIALMGIADAVAQKIKEDEYYHFFKVYPAFNLPLEANTYDLEIVLTDGGQLEDYQLSIEKLRKRFADFNTLTYDSLNAKLHLQLLVEVKPTQFSLTTALDEKRQTFYHAVLYSRYSAKTAILLNENMFDYKALVQSNKYSGTPNYDYTEEMTYVDSCTTAYQVSTPNLVDLKNWVRIDLNPPVASEDIKMKTNAKQIEKLFKGAAANMRRQVDVRYLKSKSVFYRVKAKDTDLIRMDSAFREAMQLLKFQTKENYQKSVLQFVSIIEVWKQEKLRFNADLPTEAPMVWALSMNIATASDFTENYSQAFAALDDAERTGINFREIDRLRAHLDARAIQYCKRYNQQGVYQESPLVFINEPTPIEENENLRDRKQQEQMQAIELAMQKDKVRYRFVIRHQEGTVFGKGGLSRKGYITFNPEHHMEGIQGDVPFNNMVIFHFTNEKGKQKSEVFTPKELMGFKVKDDVYESLQIELNSEEKVRNLFKDHVRFYKVLYQSPQITLYKYQNHTVSQYAFKLAGAETGYCTGFGDFLTDPNKALSKLLSASPMVSEQVANVGSTLFTDEALTQVLTSYSLSLKK